MRVRFLNHRDDRPNLGSFLGLGVRAGQRVEPGPADTVVQLELDAVVLIERGQSGLLLPTGRLLELGMRPLLGAQLLTEADELRPLRLFVSPPPQPVDLQVGDELARLLFIPTPGQRFFDFAEIDDVLNASDQIIRGAH